MPPLIDRIADRVGRSATRRPRLALAVSVIGCLVLALPALDVQLETDFFKLLPASAPAVQRFRTLLDRFGSSDLLFAVIETTAPGDAVPDDATQARARLTVARLASAIAALRWQPPGATADQAMISSIDGQPGRVTDDAFADHVVSRTWLLLDDAGVTQVVQRLEPRRLARALELGAPPGTPPALVGRDPLRLWTGLYLPFWKDHAGVDGTLRRSGGFLVAHDGRYHVLVLHPARSAQDRRFCAELVTGLKDLRAILTADPAAAGLAVHLLGGHMIADEDFRTASSNAVGNLWQGALGVLLLFALAYRSLRLTVFITITLLPATLAALGLARLVLGPELSLVAVSFATVLIGLGVDFVIHLSSAYGHELATSPVGPGSDPRPAAAHAALVRMARSILAGVLTTVVAFIALAFSAFPGVREIGVVASLGLTLMLVQLWVALPAFLARYGPLRLDPVYDLAGLGRVLVRWRWRWAAGLALVIVAAVVVLARAPAVFSFDSRPRNLRPTHDPLFENQERLCARLGLGFDRFQVLVAGADESAVIEAACAEASRLATLSLPLAGTLGEPLPAVLDEVAALACALPDTVGPRLVDTPLGRLRCTGIVGGRLLAPRWLGAHAPAAGTAAIPAGAAVQVRPLFATTAMPALALAAPSRQLAVIDRLAGIDWAGVDRVIAALPDSVRTRHDAFLVDLVDLRRRVQARQPLLPSALDATPLRALVRGFCVPDAAGGAHAVLRQIAPDLFAGLEVADIAAAAGFADGGLTERTAPGGVRLALTGVPLVNAGLQRVLLTDFRVLALVAALAVAALLAVLMATPGDAITASAALIVGLALTLAVMHLVDLHWNLVNLAVMPLILGIGIDAGIYFVNALRRQPRTRAGVAAAVADIAFPMIMTSATAIAGFASLLFNDYRGLRSMGEVAIIGMAACLLVALIGLPVWAALTTHRHEREPPG